MTGEPTRIIDISRALTPSLAVWPGDRPFGYEWTARIADGASVNLSAVSFSTHAGTHADAPLHVRRDGATLDQKPLLQFVGPCAVVEIGGSTHIGPEHVAWNDDGRCRRLLFKTRHSAVGDGGWKDELAPLLPDTVERMRQQRVCLVGTDAPSVDPVDSKTLAAHHALIDAGIVNLENLALAGVVPGAYWLVALPLKMPGLDAAPVRAVLIADGPGQET